MKEYYSERFHWIFNYTSKKFFYCLLKTLCIIIGLPIYLVSFVIEMIFTAINMIFSWIPILNVVIGVICKAIVWLFSWTFYITILTDLKAYKEARIIHYDVEDVDEQADVESNEQEPSTEQSLPSDDNSENLD